MGLAKSGSVLNIRVTSHTDEGALTMYMWGPLTLIQRLCQLSKPLTLTWFAEICMRPTLLEVHPTQIHPKLRSITPVATKVHVILRSYEFCSVNMDAWYCRISVACDTMEFEFFSSHIHWCGPLHLAFLGDAIHQHSTCGIRKRRIRTRMWHSTYWHMA